MNHRYILSALAVCLCFATSVANALTCAANIQPSNPDAAYADHGDGTVTHVPTGLRWKRCSEGQSWNGNTCTGTAGAFNWAQALTLASTSNFAGQTDWRVPNIKELRSLVEECRFAPTINDTIFPAMPSSSFWSGSAHANYSDYAWFVSFSVGYASGGLRNGGGGVRLVRGGQSFDSLGATSDATPPVVSAVGLSGIGQTSATMSASSNEAATGYWLAVPSGATAPSAAQVKSGVNYAGVTMAASGSGAMTANVPTSFPVSGLTASSSYDFYVVAMDGSGNLSAAPVKVQGSTLAAPVNTLQPLSVGGVGMNAASLSGVASTAGRVFWIAVPAGSTAPSVQQVRAGLKYSGVSAIVAGNQAVGMGGFSLSLAGLSPATAYDTYCVLQTADSLLGSLYKLSLTTQSGALPLDLKEFVFGTIPDFPNPPVSGGTLVNVHMEARNSAGTVNQSFNQKLPLTVSDGFLVSPNTVTFVNGVADASVRISGFGTTVLNLSYAWEDTVSQSSRYATGSSKFRIIKPISILEPTFTIIGRAPAGMQLYLTHASPDVHATSTIGVGANWSFTFDNLPAGSYWQIIDAATGTAPKCSGGADTDCKIYNGYGTVTVTVDAMRNCTPGHQAVLLVPGMFGSTRAGDSGGDSDLQGTSKLINTPPRLPPSQPASAADLAIYDPLVAFGLAGTTGTNIGRLREELRSAGFCVVDAPWDWRRPFGEAAATYFKPKVQEARNLVGTSTVHVVAHSTGGLVVRSYIEQQGGTDIDRFVMLGVPHLGSTKAYYLMHGGDPIALDKVSYELAKTKLLGLKGAESLPNFYTYVASSLWKTAKGKSLVTPREPGDPPGFYVKYAKEVSPGAIRAFVTNPTAGAVGGNDLLPTFNFLRKNNTTSAAQCATQAADANANPGINASLQSLNTDFLNAGGFAARYASVTDPALPGRVRVRLYLSNADPDTLRDVCYKDKGADTYPNGIPDPVTPPVGLRQTGDGTVTLSSGAGIAGGSQLFPDGVIVQGNFGGHGGMFGELRGNVCSALGGTSCTAARSAAMTKATATATATSAIASIEVLGRYALMLTGSNGAQTGTQLGVAGALQTLPNTGLQISAYRSLISESVAANGSYVLTLGTPPELENVAASLTLGYVLPNGSSQGRELRVLGHNSAPYTLTLTQDDTANGITVAYPVQPPIAVKASPSADYNTTLSWTAPADSTVTAYSIYHRPSDSSIWEQLGQVQAGTTTYATSIPWAHSYDSADEFVVLGVNAARVESPIVDGNSALNLSYARAAFTATQANASGIVQQTGSPAVVNFVNQSDATAAIQSYTWDFGDGSSAGTEASPSHTYTQPGSFSVTLTVTSVDGSTDTKTFQNFVIIGLVPTAPTMGTATPGDTQTSISFTAPSNDGGAAITSYTASCSASGQTTQSASGTSSPITVTGMTNGVTYICSVTATNSAGTGPASANISVTLLAPSTGTLITRYRLYSDGTKEHLYTTDANEYSVLPGRGWLQEGAIYKLFQGTGSLAGVDAVPYYRLYNPFTHQHHWTTDANEYNVLGAGGWSKEGVDGYILPTAVTGSVPLFRLYLNAFGGLHLWTTDANEKNVLSTSNGWVDEGVAGYVVPLP